MQAFLDAITAGAPGEELANIPIPESYRAAFVKRDEQEMWEGVASEDKDPRKSLHVDEVATPELAPDEVYVAVMAAAINFNTVWTSIFEPLPTFGFLSRLGKESKWGARHDLPYHVVGSDASGVVVGVAEVARRYEISRSLIWNWRSEARRGRLTRAAVSAFLPVQVVSEPAPSAVSLPPASPVPPLNDGQIEISLPDGSRVRVGNDVSLAALRRVMSVLRG